MVPVISTVSGESSHPAGSPEQFKVTGASEAALGFQGEGKFGQGTWFNGTGLGRPINSW